MKILSFKRLCLALHEHFNKHCHDKDYILCKRELFNKINLLTIIYLTSSLTLLIDWFQCYSCWEFKKLKDRIYFLKSSSKAHIWNNITNLFKMSWFFADDKLKNLRNLILKIKVIKEENKFICFIILKFFKTWVIF